MSLLDDPQPIYDAVYIDLEFGDNERWDTTPPMPRYVAEAVCADFAAGVPWLNGLRVTRALIVPWAGAVS